ncbi:MAG TPA: deoxyribonuclease V [Bacteroidia bacterium]|jgi:deoxyribonuclease V|nr:deoxyribonuclease V [Bacteroidia bacterium]
MPLHYENLSIPEATQLQHYLREKINIDERDALSIRTIGGADISLNLYSTTIYAGIILLSFPTLQPIAYSLVKAETRFPYVPGYLAFREVPALVQVWEQLEHKPDILVVDGHGVAHPRRLGIAAHFGAVTGQVSMGCAKNILCGKYQEPGLEKSSYSPILDKQEQIGYAFRSKSKTAPVYVSPGYGLGMKNSLAIIQQCLGKYRIPEPTRLAHELVNRFRKGELQEGYHRLS